MRNSRRQQAEQLFQEVADLPPEQRARYLARHGRDPRMVDEVRSLLHYLDAEPLPSLHCDPTANPEEDRVGTCIGPYKILQLIGEGGFGSVYMAEQTQPVRRMVALKLIKLGMDTRQVIARFEAERQALAMMDHPNIARVLDAGATDTGRPYFVMELVRGVRITDYCDQNNLSMSERLVLFMQVCRAVQHAHQKGIIHRDIKPSNVLVTLHDGEAVPKVIDFGIAKAIHQRLTDKTLFTEFLRFIGTPEYMSPEQAAVSGLDVDTRTDVYSLGVLLYELLTGTTPFTIRQFNVAAYDQIQRIIRDEDPPTPSKRLSTLGAELGTVARNRHSDPQSLTRLMRGDVDWIVMKSLEKDRTRRYETAADLAADVQRHMNHEPVLACPPGRLYRMRKFVRRNRVAVLAGSLVAVGLLASSALAMIGFVQAEHGRAEAEEARATAEAEAANSLAISSFLQDMLTMADPMQLRMLSAFAPEGEVVPLTGGGVARDMSVAEMARRAASQVDRVFMGKPVLKAVALDTIGMTMYGLGLYGEARPHLTDALRLRRGELGDDHPDTLRSSIALGNLLVDIGQSEEGEPLIGDAYEGMERIHGAKHPRTLSCASILASALCDRGRLGESDHLFAATLEAQRLTLGNEHRDTLTTMWRWAVAYLSRGRLSEGEKLAGELSDLCERTLSPDDSLNVIAQPLTGWWLTGRLQYSKAEEIMRPSLERCRRVLGEDHPFTFMTMYGLARTLQRAEAQEEKRRLFERAIAGFRSTRGRYHWQTISATWSYAVASQQWGHFDRVERLYRELLDDTIQALGENHSYVFGIMNELARFYERCGKFDEAESMYRRRLDALYRVYHPAFHSSMEDLWRMAEALVRMGRLTEAREFAAQSIEMARETTEKHGRSRRPRREYDYGRILELTENAANRSSWNRTVVIDTDGAGSRPRDVSQEVWNNYAYLLMTCAILDLRDYEKALPVAKHAANLCRGESAAVMDTLALAYHLNGDTDKALALQKLTLELVPPNQAAEPTYAAHLVQFFLASGAEEEARQAVQQAVQLYHSGVPRDDPSAGVAFRNAGDRAKEMGAFLLAEGCMIEALNLHRTRLGDEHEEIASALSDLSAIYLYLNKFDDAVSACREALEMRRRLVGDDNVAVADLWQLLGTTLAAAHRFNEAREAFNTSLATYQRLGIDGIPAALDVRIELADILVELGELDEAEKVALPLLGRLQEMFGDDHSAPTSAKFVLASVYLERGDTGRAEPLLREALETTGWLNIDEHDRWTVPMYRCALGRCLSLQDRFEEAGPLLRQGHEKLRIMRGGDFPETQTAARWLSELDAARDGNPPSADRHPAVNSSR